MGAIVEVKFFNSFLLKKINDDSGANVPAYDGSRGIPQSIGGYNQISSYDPDHSWVVEEARIRGGFNNTNVDYGVKAYAVEPDPAGYIRGNSLIYSGIFNSRTGINNTNEFPVGEEITKAVDPAKGTIQKLYAEDTNLIIFQENKVNRALIDKDAIYTAEGGGVPVSQLKLVIGQIVPYAGEYGISQNPESFAVYGYRKYFTDKRRNVVLRLSQDGITEISNYGMRDYFRDEFNSIDISGPGRIIGGWDMHSKQYVVSTRPNINASVSTFKTLSFDESVLGWTSFYSYDPDKIFSLRNIFYSLKDNKLYEHYSEIDVSGSPVNRGRFYGKDNNSTITFIFNPNVSLVKNFKTINYEGSSGWRVNSFISDSTDNEFDPGSGVQYIMNSDTTNPIRSYFEGEYVIVEASGEVDLNIAPDQIKLTNVIGQIIVGAPVIGPGIIPNTTVQAWNPSTLVVTLNQNVNAVRRKQLTFTTEVLRSDYTTAFGTNNPPYDRFHAGFDRKENKYFANLVNNSAATIGEVRFGGEMTGIKGFFTTIQISTDMVIDANTHQAVSGTDIGGIKELFAVSSDYVESSY